jgi:hypothetical protein
MFHILSGSYKQKHRNDIGGTHASFGIAVFIYAEKYKIL